VLYEVKFNASLLVRKQRFQNMQNLSREIATLAIDLKQLKEAPAWPVARPTP
jgi:hypothetical protein